MLRLRRRRVGKLVWLEMHHIVFIKMHIDMQIRSYI